MLSLALPIFLLQIYDRIIPNQGLSTLTFFAIGFLCVLIVDAILTLSRAYITGWSGAKLHHAISCAAMDRMLSSQVQAFEANAPGIQLQRLRAIETLRGFYSGQAALLWIDLPFAALFLSLIAVIGGTLVALPIIILAATAGAAIWCGRNLHAALEDRTGNDNRRYNFIIRRVEQDPDSESDRDRKPHGAAIRTSARSFGGRDLPIHLLQFDGAQRRRHVVADHDGGRRRLRQHDGHRWHIVHR